MPEIVCVQVIWNRERPAIPPMKVRQGDYLHNVKFFPVYVDPEPEHPVGRKGLVLASAWQALASRNAAGMLIKDGDVAIDPYITARMIDAIESDPGVVWTAPVRLWPTSTHRPDWVWAHWDEKAGQELEENPVKFSFCFTYLPRAVVAASVRAGLKRWVYPQVDAGVSRTAQSAGVKVRVVADCHPVHAHF